MIEEYVLKTVNILGVLRMGQDILHLLCWSCVGTMGLVVKLNVH